MTHKKIIHAYGEADSGHITKVSELTRLDEMNTMKTTIPRRSMSADDSRR